MNKLARQARAVFRYAKATFAPTPTEYQRKREALHAQLRREVTERELVAAVERAVR